MSDEYSGSDAAHLELRKVDCWSSPHVRVLIVDLEGKRGRGRLSGGMDLEAEEWGRRGEKRRQGEVEDEEGRALREETEEIRRLRAELALRKELTEKEKELREMERELRRRDNETA